MHSVIRIGSRESALAVRQAEIIRDLILEHEPETEIEIITMKTTGDKILDKSLEKIGGKGLFVKELDRALMEGRIDLAVHSLKDMPMEENEEDPCLWKAGGSEGRPDLQERTDKTAGASGDRYVQQAPCAADGAALPGVYLPRDPGKCADKDEKAGGGRI